MAAAGCFQLEKRQVKPFLTFYGKIKLPMSSPRHPHMFLNSWQGATQISGALPKDLFLTTKMNKYENKRHMRLMVQVESFLLPNGVDSQEHRLGLALLLLGCYRRHQPHLQK